MRRVGRVGHFQALKCSGRSPRTNREQYLAFSPCLAHSCGRRALGSALCRDIVGNQGHSALALLTANFKNPLSHASYASHTSHLQPFKTPDRRREIEIYYRQARSTDKKKTPLGRGNVLVARNSHMRAAGTLPLPFDQVLTTSDQPPTAEMTMMLAPQQHH